MTSIIIINYLASEFCSFGLKFNVFNIHQYIDDSFRPFVFCLICVGNAGKFYANT